MPGEGPDDCRDAPISSTNTDSEGSGGGTEALHPSATPPQQQTHRRDADQCVHRSLGAAVEEQEGQEGGGAVGAESAQVTLQELVQQMQEQQQHLARMDARTSRKLQVRGLVCLPRVHVCVYMYIYIYTYLYIHVCISKYVSMSRSCMQRWRS